MSRGHMLLMILKTKKLLECFTKTNYKTNQKQFRTEKVIKRKSDKFHVKLKGYDSSFNNCIDKKDIS